jgi:hypothetical protein
LAVTFVWLASGPNEAWSEVIVKTGATAALLLIFPIVYLWKLVRAGEMAHRRSPMLLILIGAAVVVAGLAIVGIGVMQTRAAVTPGVRGAVSGNPLQDRIEAFLAKHGRKATYYPHDDATVQMADSSDGRGSFISYWDRSMGAWPTEADGFTADQLRRSPPALAANPFEWGLGFGAGPKEFGQMKLWVLTINGRNNSDTEVAVTDAYLVSAVTGEKRAVKVNSDKGLVDVSAINPVPPDARLPLWVDFDEANGGMPEITFLEKWTPLDVVISFDGKVSRHRFRQKLFIDTFESLRPKPKNEPRITVKPN